MPLFQQAMERGRQRQLHFVGLLSDGGVHSHIQHLFALLELAKKEKVEKVFVHVLTDGRDTPPNSGRDFVRRLQQKMRELGVGEIATVVGRYYAMDRDNRWERVQLAYDALVHGMADTKSNDPVQALQANYEQGVTDEFVKPIVITRGAGPEAAPVGLIRDDDAVIFYNFRADRARQMTYALAAPDFDKFVDPKRPKNLFYVAMTKYDKKWAWLKAVITPEKLEHILAQVFQELQYKNLRCAETEKYAHVTYFFNGGVEKPFSGEERILVPSPKVATYDLMPEMSAAGITETVVKAIEKGEFDAIIMNYANADMVGHSGESRSHHQGGRSRRCRPRQHLSGDETTWRRVDRHRGPRERGNHDRSQNWRPAHLSHDQSGSAALHHGERSVEAFARRRVARYRPHHAEHSR